MRFEASAGRVPSATEAAASRLCSPIDIGPVALAQRTWVPAMVPWRATEDGYVAQEVIAWYERFARGMPHAIVVEATGIRDVPSGPLLRIGHDRFLPGLARLVETVRRASQGRTRLLIQLIDFLTIRRRPEGKFPEGVRIDSLPLNLERNEMVIWLFNNAGYYSFRNRTRYVGSSQGVSIRVMKGVYYCIRAFKGEPVKTQYLSGEGQGIFLIASRNAYFWSPQKAFKLPIKKILSVQPYSDGIQIMRDTTNAVPQIFKLDAPYLPAMRSQD